MQIKTSSLGIPFQRRYFFVVSFTTRGKQLNRQELLSQKRDIRHAKRPMQIELWLWVTVFYFTGNFAFKNLD
jgi:hypothetical protein